MEYSRTITDIEHRNRVIVDRIKELEERNNMLRQLHEEIKRKLEQRHVKFPLENHSSTS